MEVYLGCNSILMAKNSLNRSDVDIGVVEDGSARCAVNQILKSVVWEIRTPRSGKTVVIAPDVPGFLANRLMAPLGLNAIRMLEAGIATKEEIAAGWLGRKTGKGFYEYDKETES